MYISLFVYTGVKGCNHCTLRKLKKNDLFPDLMQSLFLRYTIKKNSVVSYNFSPKMKNRKQKSPSPSIKTFFFFWMLDLYISFTKCYLDISVVRALTLLSECSNIDTNWTKGLKKIVPTVPSLNVRHFEVKLFVFQIGPLKPRPRCHSKELSVLNNFEFVPSKGLNLKPLISIWWLLFMN